MFKKIAALSIACVGIVSAQAPVAPAGPRLVTVNVMVTKDKKPVKGLTKADFVLEDKNKAQNIAFFAIADDSKAAAPLDPAISSNRLDSQGKEIGAATVILYDRVNHSDQSFQARMRNEILKALASLKPTDRVGFYSLGLGLSIVRDYNEEAGILPAVAKALQSNTPVAQLKTDEEKALHATLTAALLPVQNVQQQQQKVNITYPAFRLIASHLQGAPGRRNLLWIASTFPLTFGGTDQERRQTDEAEIETFRQVLNNAGVSLYPVNPGGAGANFAGATLAGQQTMQLLADSTGGEAFRSANDLVQPMKDVVAATTYSYVLGFYPDAASLDDKNHVIRVTLAKKPETDKAKVLHRKDYVAWNPAAANSAPEVQQLKTRLPIKDLMEQKVLETGIGLLGVANPEPSDPTVQAFDIRIDARDLRFEPKDGKWVANLTIALGADSAAGARLLGQEDYTASLTEAEWKEAMDVNGIDIRRNVAVGAGTMGTMRIGVQDKATGAAGSVKIRYGGR